jgi:hypothetical protein
MGSPTDAEFLDIDERNELHITNNGGQRTRTSIRELPSLGAKQERPNWHILDGRAYKRRTSDHCGGNL